MAVVLALSASLLYGAADFLGGLASRRQAVLGVVVASQAAGSLGLLLVLPLLPAALPGPADLALGAVGGLAGAVAVVCLYRGLAEGRMSVVAPVAALSGLTLPVAGGLAMGERPGALAVAGMALSALAVWLLGRGPSAVAEADGARPRRALWLALASGVGGGAFYVLLQRTSPEAGAWPLLAGRAASLTVLTAATGWSLPALKRASPRLLALMAAAGLLDTAANAFYLWASKQGMLSVVATLASLYPASTVLLARLTLRERLEPGQRAGLAVGTLALPLLVGR